MFKFMCSLLVSVLLCTQIARATTIIYVDANATGANDGTSWCDAFLCLQSALNAVTTPSTTEIRVAANSYYPSSPSGATATFLIPSGLKLRGGFAGCAAEPGGGDAQSGVSYLKGLYATCGGSSGGNVYHVVTLDNCNSDTLIENFAIEFGRATGPGTNQDRGGAILILEGAPVIDHCTITGSQADTAGGLIYAENSSFHLLNSNLQKGSMTINYNGVGQDVAIFGNTETECLPQIINCNIAGGGGGPPYASEKGGGIYLDLENGKLLVRDTAIGSFNARLGAGIYVADGELEMSYSSITGTIVYPDGNSDLGLGADLYIEAGGTYHLADCRFGGGTVSSTALGTAPCGVHIYMENNAEGHFANCVFRDHYAYDTPTGSGSTPEGGAFVNFGDAELINCTFRTPTFTLDSVGDVYTGNTGTTNISNSILYAEVATPYSIDNHGTTTVSYSDILGGYSGTGNINTNPTFPSQGDDELPYTSPCWNSGSNGLIEADWTDLDNDANRTEDTPRDLDIIYVSQPKVTRRRIEIQTVDMGAVESCDRPCIGDWNASGGTPDDSDISAFLADWNAGETCADVDHSGGTPDDNDVGVFFDSWNNGC